MIYYFGETKKGKQPTESAEMITFFNYIKKHYPDIAKVATHIRNEGKRNIAQTQKQKSEGMIKGASDIFIHGRPSFCCELKTHSKSSKPSKEQIAYLESVDKLGGFACVARGCAGALEALEAWINEQAR
jgi:hypothetical protein|tara:strand:+ start:522 stop:908 length:387 start_codon:yes stop_codon:yes gene_type:complete